MYRTKLAGIKKATLVSVLLGYILFVVQIVLFVRKGGQMNFLIGLKGFIFLVAPACMYWVTKKLDDEYMLKVRAYYWPIAVFAIIFFFTAYGFSFWEILEYHEVGVSSFVFMTTSNLCISIIQMSIAKNRETTQ
jgi:hypothetical protein